MENLDTLMLTLVGAGNMGGALLAGWIANGVQPSNITAIDPNPPEAARQSGVKLAASAEGLLPADVLVIAIKPQLFSGVLPGLRSIVAKETVVVSVAAGQTVDAIAALLGHEGGIVRTMPNTPALVGRGVTGAFANPSVSKAQRTQIDGLLKAVGKVAWVEDEGLIDAVTAVSGSGPAYVFYLAEAMAQAGVAAGLPEKLAQLLARETVCGAGELLHRSPDTAARLRQNVTSPKGTTAAALDVLMAQDGLAPLMEKAVAAAKKRAQELSA